jgi:phosphoglucosamine mutase
MAGTLRFGTDGIRGRAGQFPIDTTTAWALGRVLGLRGSVLVARDSRCSGPELSAALLEGARSAGAHAESVGVLPTPALSVLLAEGWARWGVMVTASHNPPHDNGLKVLRSSGHKLDDEQQLQVQDALNEVLPLARSEHRGDAPPPSEPRYAEARDTYLAALRARLPSGRWLEGCRVVLDAAHGAGCGTGPALLEALGAELVPMACEPDGERINVGCGAVHTGALARRVVSEGAQLGIALDGDADRGLMVSASGRQLDGDAMLYLLAGPPAVVGTIMSGGGVQQALAARGIELLRTPVGDRFVDAAVHERGLSVGAETSGHVCLADGLPTADGMLSALRVLCGGVDLDSRLADYHPWPRVQHNVPVTHRPPIESIPELAEVCRSVEAELGDDGRTLLRYSGTEPLLRVLVEGRDESSVQRAAGILVQAVRHHIGA